MTDIAWTQAAITAARPRAVAALLRYFRDLDAAEEGFQEACLRALKTWPQNGPPRDPAAWLIMVGRNAAIDGVRRRSRQGPLPDEAAISDLDDAEEALAGRPPRPRNETHPLGGLDMHSLLIVAVIVLVVIAGVLAFASTRPSVFRLARSAEIKAPPEAIYPHVADFHRWLDWSPWEGIDADLKRTYSGAASGVGAVYAWEGKKTGAGRMEVIDAASPRHVGIKLDFIRPMPAHNVCEFTFEPTGQAGVTAVTWSMHGPAPLMTKVFHLFIDMDKMLGPSFEQGLARLKAVAEG
jgi:hypothetical protein